MSYPALKVTKTIPSGRKHAICALASHPEAGEAVFADIGGHWGLLEDIETSEAEHREETKAEQEDMEALFNDDEDEENSFSVAKVSNLIQALLDNLRYICACRLRRQLAIPRTRRVT